MAQIKIIDRAALRAIHAEALEALKPIADKYGITFSPGPSKFSDAGTGVLSLNIGVNSADGVVESVERNVFLRNAHIWGLKASDLGETFTNGGQIYEITGANAKKPRYRIQTKRLSDGQIMNFPSESVRDALTIKRLRAA